MRLTGNVGFGVLTCAVMLAGCSSSVTEGGSPRQETAFAQFSQTPRYSTLDDIFLEISLTDSSFGGAYFSTDGELHVVSSERSNRAASWPLLQKYLPAGARSSVPRFVLGKYSFRALRNWKTRLSLLHTIKGVAFTDADERSNRVVVAIYDRSIEGEVHRVIAELDVPQEAVEIRLAERASLTSTLFSRLTPLRGGLGLTIAHPGNVGSGCTLGLVVGMAPGPFSSQYVPGARYGLTAGHCFGAEKIGLVDSNEVAHQWTVSPANRIGAETYERPTWPGYSLWGTCPTGRVCKGSDVSAVRLERDSSALGWIAATLGPPTQASQNTNVINVWDSLFVLDPFQPDGPLYPADWVGRFVHKVGAQTGWTEGAVQSTCVDVPMFDGPVDLGITLLCQNIASGFAVSGDSGSPVLLGSAVWEVAGLLWGALSYNGATAIVYSPWGIASFELIPLGNTQVVPPL